MKRRKFVRNLSLLAPGIILQPSFLKAMVSPRQTAGNVIIVGAGVSGLYAAKVLKEAGVNVTILEASAVHGGRVRTITDFADFPIEAGAEYVQGKENVDGDPHTFFGAVSMHIIPTCY
jgi:NADPH-dependent 2,4-dienoyl-CoA reductase/sulfur reductase-like enzyme